MSKKLTQIGFERLQTEYENLLYSKRPQILKGITNAAAEGDRSENAEYIYGKKHLRELDKRLAYLVSLLKDVQVIDLAKQPKNQVCFGTTVTVQDNTKAEKTLMIVGEGETDFYPNSISEKSPVAQALLGKQIGDITEIYRPKGIWEVEVLKIL